MSNRPTFSILMFSLFALAMAACGGEPMAPDPFVAPNPMTTGPVTTGTPTTSSSSSGTAGAAQATTTSGPATTTGSAGAGGASGSSAMTTTGAGSTAPAVDAGSAGGSTEAGTGCGTMCPPDAGSDAAAWADAKDGTIGPEASSSPDAGTTMDSGTTPPPDTGTRPMKPALYLIFDQTYWSIAKDFPQNPGKVGWPIFSGGVKQYVATSPDAYMAVQYEPIKKPGSNSATPANYSPPAVAIGSLKDPAQAAAITASLDAQPTTNSNTGDCQLGPATQAALDYLATALPADGSARIILFTRYAQGVTMPQALHTAGAPKLFVVSVHSPYDSTLFAVSSFQTAGMMAMWGESEADIATLLSQIAAWQPPATTP
jgi:hypothetical protein